MSKSNRNSAVKPDSSVNNMLKIEEFLNKQENNFKPDLSNNQRKSNPFKLHRTSKTTFIQPFDSKNISKNPKAQKLDFISSK